MRNTREVLAEEESEVPMQAPKSQDDQKDQSQREGRLRWPKERLAIEPHVEMTTSKGKTPAGSKRDRAKVQPLREQMRQLCLSLFFREDDPTRVLGFTSAIKGEGKTFLSMTTADILAKDCSAPTTLVECNWDHPSLAEQFGVPATPGLAEWLRGDCDIFDIRHTAHRNLTVIPAGEGRRDAVKLLRELRQRSLTSVLASLDEVLVVDLPPVMACAYGVLAASLAESLIVVVRARATPEAMVEATSAQLAELPVRGMVLNQVESRIPRWVQQLL